MDNIDREIAAVLHIPIVGQAHNIDKSLRELYDERKKALGLSDRFIHRLLGVEKNTLDPILNGAAKSPGLIVMVKLGHFLGLSISDMAEKYTESLTPKQIGELQHSRVIPFLIEHFDLNELRSLKLLPSQAPLEEIESRIVEFFGLDNIYEYATIGRGFALSRTKISRATKMRTFWLKSAYMQFKKIANPHPYSRSELIRIIPKIRPYCTDISKGLAMVMKALYYCGVTVIYQSTVVKSGIRGATMLINDKPCIVISDHGKRYPTLWFSLMHELYHVLYDLKDISNRTYHISDDDGDIFLLNEERANYFANEYFVESSRMKYVRPYISTPTLVAKLAREWSVHPSLIYARYAHETGLWSHVSKHIPQATEALKNISTDTFTLPTLEASAIIYKNRYETV